MGGGGRALRESECDHCDQSESIIRYAEESAAQHSTAQERRGDERAGGLRPAKDSSARINASV